MYQMAQGDLEELYAKKVMQGDLAELNISSDLLVSASGSLAWRQLTEPACT